MERRLCYRILNVCDEIYAAHPAETRIKQQKKGEKIKVRTHRPLSSRALAPSRVFASRCDTPGDASQQPIASRRVGPADSAKPSVARARRGFANYHERLNINAKSGRRTVGRARHTMRRKVESREHETLVYTSGMHTQRPETAAAVAGSIGRKEERDRLQIYGRGTSLS